MLDTRQGFSRCERLSWDTDDVSLRERKFTQANALEEFDYNDDTGKQVDGRRSAKNELITQLLS